MIKRLQLRDLIETIGPHLQNQAARLELVSSSLGPHTPLLTQLDMESNANEFATLLVLHCLSDFGPGGESSQLARLLHFARLRSPADKQLEIDQLLQFLQPPS